MRAATFIKSDAARYIVAAVEALAKHQPFFSSQVSVAILGAFLRESAAKQAAAGNSSLTPREREVLQLLAAGTATRDRAAARCFRPRRWRRTAPPPCTKSAQDKLADLVRYAVRNRIIAYLTAPIQGLPG